MSTIERFTVTSGDGVAISIQKTGTGPALLLIHGALLNATAFWGPMLPSMASHFTVYAMDRRGREPSGDAEDYSFSNEADDIVRVVESIGQSVSVLAHSYGALLTLEALNKLKSVPRLIFYEPPVTLSPTRQKDFEKIHDDMEVALQRGDREELVRIFICDRRGEPERLPALQSSPIWPLALQIAHTLPREVRAVDTYRDWSVRLANCKIPTLVLLGSKTTAPELRDGSIFVSQAIPGCRLVVLEGQGHIAMLEAPDFFADKIVNLLASAFSVGEA